MLRCSLNWYTMILRNLDTYNNKFSLEKEIYLASVYIDAKNLADSENIRNFLRKPLDTFVSRCSPHATRRFSKNGSDRHPVERVCKYSLSKGVEKTCETRIYWWVGKQRHASPAFEVDQSTFARREKKAERTSGLVIKKHRKKNIYRAHLHEILGASGCTETTVQPSEKIDAAFLSIIEIPLSTAVAFIPFKTPPSKVETFHN